MKVSRSQINSVLLVIFVLCASIQVLGQKQMTGTWKSRYSEKTTESIHISFNSDTQDGNHQHGSSFKFERLQGLSPDQALSASSTVGFSILSEAGNIDLNGTFKNGSGRGTFIFTPNSSFAAGVKALGFKEPSAARLFSSAILDVKLSTVSDLRNSGIELTDYEDVIKATIFKIDSAYMNDMSNAGFENLDMEDLVKGRIFKIDADYARQVNTMGFGNRSLEELVKFRIFKITPEFLSEMRAEGFSQLTPEQVVKLRIFNIDSEFINEARAKGNANPSVEELVQLRIRGKIN